MGSVHIGLIHLARGRRERSREEVEEGRLAAAIGADESDARVHGELKVELREEQAARAANTSSLICTQLAAEQNTTAATVLQAQRAVWRWSAGSARSAGQAVAQQLAQHVASQLQSVRGERLPVLSRLMEGNAALSTWSGLQSLIDSKRSVLNTLIGCAANTSACNASGTSEQLAAQTFLQEAHSLLSQLPLDDELGSGRLELLQLELELVAQVASATLWLYYVIAATRMHTAIDGHWQVRAASTCPHSH